MHPKCRIASLALTSRLPRGCGSDRSINKSHNRHLGIYLASHRSFSGSCVTLGTNTGQPQPCARPRTNTTGRTAYLLLQPMDLPANVANARYDWRTFANPGAELHYITTEATANERIARLASRPSPFAIGLDFEWRPTFTAGIPENPISLVQVACDDEILLVQVGAMQGNLHFTCRPWTFPGVTASLIPITSGFPTGLRNLLESANSTKVGVGIQCKSGLQLPFSPIIVYCMSDVRIFGWEMFR